ncbi:putative chloride channel [Phaeomoniella chlamydospora]|uniref:Chloride channel protein n=1 Tax=Phaeomoniella chlamydospora TaxID=158046 RepID=A0A0G2HJX4_PHACM|nr:putative chloride channel [Phaeomoniella chlamydospora]
MAGDEEQPDERTALLTRPNGGRLSALQHREDDEHSVISSHLSKEELALGETAVGERLPYNDYTTIDWLHDLIKDSYRRRLVHSQKGLRHRCYTLFDQSQGWIAAALSGILTACVAFIIDMGVATISGWKTGYCSSNPLKSREDCCTSKSPLFTITSPFLKTFAEIKPECGDWHVWSDDYWRGFGIYVGFALVFGILSGLVTLTTKKSLPAAAPGLGDKYNDNASEVKVQAPSGKSMYMSAGSGIPEIKTILSGFVIPHFLDLKVLIAKAVGSIFAVSTGMNLGKEGPLVHISTSVAYLVGMRFPKYRENGRKMREMLSAGCASGLTVAFGAPIGGTLFSYEEISTYFPRKVLYRAFLCSLFAAVVLKALNPTGTGKLVLFETNYGTTYKAYHYAVFILLGVIGGLYGGVFCKANFFWSRKFRRFSLIKNNPVLEVFLVTLVTALLQYPNPVTREMGDIVIRNLLVQCDIETSNSWVCVQESKPNNGTYLAWLVYGTLVKLILTVITFGIKVPLGIIIPSLDAGAFFGRLIGQAIPGISSGIFAMVGAAAFLAGVSRQTISLCVIMFELTGELEYVVPHMIAILVAKWVADALEREGVYDLAQAVLGHPFLDADHAMQLIQSGSYLVEELIPPSNTMREITVEVLPSGHVPRIILEEKLNQLKRRGLMDAGLVLVQNHSMLQGYLAQGELEFGLLELGPLFDKNAKVRLLGPSSDDSEFDMTQFVDRTPLTIVDKAPMEYAVEMFAKLGLRHLIVLEDGTGEMKGVIIKKRLVVWLESLKH